MNHIISIQNVSKAFQGKVLYENINLEIEKGTCIGFVGSNGVGKSVLFSMICGLLPTSAGSIHVRGTAVGGKDGVFADSVGILINSPGYIDYYSGYYNLKLLANIKGTTSDDKIKESMHICGLDPNNKTPVKKYSMGMKQKLGIAQAIMEDQEILLLDEAFNSLDFTTNRELTKLIKILKMQGKTILLTSHQHEYLEKLCDQILLIHEKQLVPFTDEWKKMYFE